MPKRKYITNTKTKKVYRDGDELVTITTRRESAIIDFEEILEACKVEHDDDTGPPWKDCDGYEHTFTPIIKFDDEHLGDRKLAEGWVSRSSGPDGLITVDTDDVIHKWMGERGDHSGMTKQVYAEYIAATKRKAILQLVDWYVDGWYVWGVTCDFRGEEASLWGIHGDSSGDDEHVQECKREVAIDVARQLEKRGFTVINRPPSYNSKTQSRRNWRWQLARHLGFADYESYQRWVRSRE